MSMFIFPVDQIISLAQSSNVSTGFPFIDAVIVLAGVAGAVFAVCRSANRR